MTKARTLADFDASTAGKVLQVVTQSLATTTHVQAGTPADLITKAITLSDAANYLYIIASVNYDINGAGSSAAPSGIFKLTSGSTILTQVQAYRDAHANSASLTGGTTLQAYYSPSTTSETVKLVGSTSAGDYYVQGSNQQTNGTILTIMEIAA